MKKCLLPALLLCLLLCACAGESVSAPVSSAQPFSETPAATEPAPETALPSPAPLRISEAMSANKSTICREDGSFPDWVELCNEGEEPLSLEGCTLCCGGGRCVLPAVELGAGEYALVFCSRSATGFGISDEGERLRLLDPWGRELDSVLLPALETDCAWTPAGVTAWPTPGYENSPAGYEQLQDSRRAEELAIGEAVVRGEAGDWVELVNAGTQVLRLEDYFLSDREQERSLYPLSGGALAPGERRVIRLDQTPFSLNARRDQLYLSRRDGTLVDYVNLHDLPEGGSLGRTEGEGGFWYYPRPSQGQENGQGFRRVSACPQTLEPDGVYNGAEQVTVVLTGAGEIRYTTDGSLPTSASELYTEPLKLTETGVIRAVCTEEGALPSKPLNLTYLINEYHSLPVTSLVCDPELLFGPGGIYDNTVIEAERPGALMFYDGEERFSLNCGVRPHGAYSRQTEPKKTLKVVFRDRYDGQLHFDLFRNGVTDFSSILLRAPTELTYSSQIRDSLMHRLAAEAFPALPTQASRYSVLYINGRYWGVYSLREAHSPEHYANHYGADADRVLQYRGGWGRETGFDEIYSFALYQDMTQDENYAYVAAHLDLDSVIGWAVMEAFGGNIDSHCTNMRFYYTLDDQVLHYGLVDLDLGMDGYPGFDSAYAMGYSYNALLTRLTRNGQFRAEFLRQYGQALDGALAVEHVQAAVDQMAREIRPEMIRDAARWGGSAFIWEDLVQNVRNYFTAYGDYEDFLNWSLSQYMGGTPEWEDWIARRQG